MSRIRSGVPIYCLTPHDSTRNRVAIIRGVYPVHFNPEAVEKTEVARAAVAQLLKYQTLNRGDWVLLWQGDHYGVTGATNSMKLLCMDDFLDE